MYEILHKDAPKDELAFYLSYAEKGMSILEPLCGSGRFLVPFMERGFDISAMDLSAEMLAKLKEKVPNAKVFQGDILEYECESEFDYIFISSGSVSLFTDMEVCRAILQKMKCLLKKGGKFVFVVDTVADRYADSSDYHTSISVKTKEGNDLILKGKNYYDEETQTQYSPSIYELYDRTLAESIAYTVLSGCGMDMGQLKDGYIFEYINKFNTTDTLFVLGNAINRQAKPFMTEIGHAVRQYEKQAQKRFTNIPRKDIENAPDRDYNNNRNNSIEKDTENETGIQAGRGLPGTGYRDGRTARRGDKEIRTSEEKLPGGEQRRDFYSDGSFKQANGTPAYGTGAGRGENGQNNKTDGRSRRGGRNPESRRPDVMGSENGEHQAEEIVLEEIIYN